MRSMLKEELGDPVDRPFVWRPSAADRRTNPEIPKDAQLPGRLVVVYAQDPTTDKPVRVCLFSTNLLLSPQELACLYARRWNVETDLRSMKREVGLEILRARNPETLAKELIFAVVAYNLVRVFMALAAQRKGLEPRRMSFTRAKHILEIYARRGPIDEKKLETMFDLLTAKPLSIRSKRKHPPRSVWRRPISFPGRKPAER